MEKASQRPASGTNNGPASDDDRNPNPNTNTNSNSTARDNMVKDDGKTKTGKKTLWVDVQKCFNCGKHGHRLPKCTQCSQAFYCDSDCQRKHWRKHKPVCRAAVAALARHATRERLARAVRKKGKEKVEGGDQDDLCVICQAKPVDPVEVSWILLMHVSNLVGGVACRSCIDPWCVLFPHLRLCHAFACGSSRVATSTASRASRSYAEKAWTSRALSVASRCHPGQTSSST